MSFVRWKRHGRFVHIYLGVNMVDYSFMCKLLQKNRKQIINKLMEIEFTDDNVDQISEILQEYQSNYEKIKQLSK